MWTKPFCQGIGFSACAKMKMMAGPSWKGLTHSFSVSARKDKGQVHGIIFGAPGSGNQLTKVTPLVMFSRLVNLMINFVLFCFQGKGRSRREFQKTFIWTIFLVAICLDPTSNKRLVSYKTILTCTCAGLGIKSNNVPLPLCLF